MMRVFAPGRVNLIGDHVDYVGGVVLPMAVHLGTTVDMTPTEDNTVRVRSTNEATEVAFELPVADVSSIEPGWGRFVAAVCAELELERGFVAEVDSTLPVGAGLSSSSSFTVALALAAGFEGTPTDLAHACLRAEVRATGVPGGIMDQLTIAAATRGAALRIDCRDDTYSPVALPQGTAVHAVHCGVSRRLVGSEYAERRAACEAAEAIVGPLRDASLADLAALDDAALRARARHVVTEIERVEEAVDACLGGESAALGSLMVASHASLRDDFAVSIPELDDLVDRLCAVDGVYGARLTGAGFGGCVVAVADEDVDPEAVGGWRLEPHGAARAVT